MLRRVLRCSRGEIRSSVPDMRKPDDTQTNLLHCSHTDMELRQHHA